MRYAECEAMTAPFFFSTMGLHGFGVCFWLWVLLNRSITYFLLSGELETPQPQCSPGFGKKVGEPPLGRCFKEDGFGKSSWMPKTPKTNLTRGLLKSHHTNPNFQSSLFFGGSESDIVFSRVFGGFSL